MKSLWSRKVKKGSSQEMEGNVSGSYDKNSNEICMVQKDEKKVQAKKWKTT